jgi:RimJ/RimL family protein N-acetyltransferase
MRLALVEAGRGQGGGFVRALLDHAFGSLAARRVWLDCGAENLRGQRVYERAGFTLEGRFRRHHRVPATGHLVDILFYGMLREEWEALEPPSARA